MNKIDRHQRISALLQNLEINNNRLSLHDESISALDVEVLRQQCIALYQEILMLSANENTVQQEVQNQVTTEQNALNQMEEVKQEEVAPTETPAEIPPDGQKPKGELKEEPAQEEATKEEPQSIYMKLQDEAEMVSLFEKFNSKPIKEIAKAISISKRFEFQNNFFEGDAKEYKQFISLIDKANDRETAFQIYHDYKQRLNWENEELKDELKSLLYRKYAT